jgi:hypothetical protein
MGLKEILAQQKWNEKSFYLILFWFFGIIVSVILLLLALVIDEFITCEVDATLFSGRVYQCGAVIIKASSGGTKTISYVDDCGGDLCEQTAGGGTAWIVLNVFALLSYMLLGYATRSDYQCNEIDSFPLNDTVFSYAITFPKSWGLTTFSLIWIVFWQILAIVIFASDEQCSTEKMWTDEVLLTTLDDFNAFGGASMAFGALSLISLGVAVAVLIAAYVTGAKGVNSQTAEVRRRASSAPPPVPSKPPPEKGLPQSGAFAPQKQASVRSVPAAASPKKTTASPRPGGAVPKPAGPPPTARPTGAPPRPGR